MAKKGKKPIKQYEQLDKTRNNNPPAGLPSEPSIAPTGEVVPVLVGKKNVFREDSL
jgi:hypothetical protein